MTWLWILGVIGYTICWLCAALIIYHYFWQTDSGEDAALSVLMGIGWPVLLGVALFFSILYGLGKLIRKVDKLI